jgi:hypothetical protein
VEGKERGGDSGEGLPKIELKSTAQGQWSGTWTKPDGKPVALNLRLAQAPAPATDANPYLKELYADNLYEYLRLSGLTLKKGKRDTVMGHTLQWWDEPDSNISFFEILDGYPDAQRKAINELLRSRLWQEVSNFHNCMSFPYGSYNQTVTPNLLSPNVISISVYTDYFCGGAYPDWGDRPINLNARTVRALTLEDILWTGEGDPMRYASDLPFWARNVSAGDFDDYARYRETYLAPWLIGQLKILHPESTDESGCDDYGNEENTDFWRFPTWSLTPEGIVFTPSYPHVAAVCRIPVTLPYEVARQRPGVLKLALP